MLLPAFKRKYSCQAKSANLAIFESYTAGRRAQIHQPRRAPPHPRTNGTPEASAFALLLAGTGGRISEVLSVTPQSFQIERNIVTPLKRRRTHFREVPIMPGLMAAIDQHFGLRALQRDPDTANRRLGSCSRVTAWRFVKGAMLEAGIVGRPACPRGLRHGFGVAAQQAFVPLNLLQRWVGHARLSSTAVYTSVCGDEETAFAERFWGAD
jgi:integrase/recombinase XerD